VPVLRAEELTEGVIGLAIEVHRRTGPRLLESVYELCLCHELREACIPFERQAAIPLMYKAVPVAEAVKADIVVSREVILEIKSVAAILPVHEAQLHTYPRMSGLRVGLNLNANGRRLTDGLHRFIL
jgi:GxxExxY protein